MQVRVERAGALLAWLALLALPSCTLPRGALTPASGTPDDGGLLDAGATADTGTTTLEDSGSPDRDAQSVDDAGRSRCGDGIRDGSEACDDGDDGDGDGCSASCRIEPGFVCTGAPSVCTTECGDGVVAGAERCDGGRGCTACVPDDAQAVTRSGLGLAIPDDTYDGTMGTMTCVQLELEEFPLDTVAAVEVVIAISHEYVGDLTMKLFSPAGSVVTLVSRPGAMERADDGGGGGGDGSFLAATSPITFSARATTPSEDMGAGLRDDQTVCQDDHVCAFAPTHGAAAPGDFESLVGTPAHGAWRVCVADGATNDVGTLESVSVKVSLR